MIDSNSQFRILILGDFSGRANARICRPFAGRKALEIDRDNFEEVMASLNPTLSLSETHLTFRELDDFHPDHIYRQIRKPRTVAPPPPPRSGLLDSILEETQPVAPKFTGDLADFIAQVTKESLAPREEKESTDPADSVDMRAILHDPDFQALEAAWRAVFMLVRGLDTDGDLKLYLLDATRDELAADLTGAVKLLVRPQEPWALIVGNCVFGQTEGDAKLLSACGRIASHAGAPFIAEALPPGDDASDAWETLRRSPEARSVGLALPRFLLRLPYGKQTSPIESFDFEEMPVSIHQQYLWGNPAFACALLLGLSFLDEGWNLRPGSHRQIAGLPLHVFQENGDSNVKPCAEVLLSEKQATFIMDQGFMPLATLKDQDAALLVRFQSIAEPLAALAGRWQNA